MASRFSCRRVLLFAASVMLFPYEANAQGFFDKVSIPKSVIATGQTETLGFIELTLRQNSTVGDTLTVDVSPLQITNTDASDISVSVSGAITIGTPTFIPDQGQFKIPVNGGATSGSIIIQGIRVAVAGTGVTSITTNLSWDRGENYFGNGTTSALTTSTSVLVVDKVLNGLVVDPVTTDFLIYNNQVVKNTGIIVVHEGFAGAFVSSSNFGQNTPTQIQIRLSDMPAGLTMHFPASVTANETAATLTLAGGNPVDVTSIGNSAVVYSYNDAGPSRAPQSFNIPFTVSISGTLGTTQPTIDASLFPIGAAVPNATLPATNVTRFAAGYQLALPGTSKIITQTLYWTGIDTSRDNRISIQNPTSGNTNLTLTAFDAGGNSLGSGPIHQSLSANQSLNDTLTDIFGSGLSIATVQVQSTASGVLALGTSANAGVVASLQLSDQAALGFMLPSFGDNAQINIFNPQSITVNGSLTLLSIQGTVLASRTISLQPTVSSSVSIQQLFGTTATGQVSATFSSPVIALEASVAGGGLNYVQPQIPFEVPTWYAPFVAAGGPYETDLSLINPSSQQPAILNVQLFDSTGNPQATAQQIMLAPSAQLLTSVSQLFNLSNATTGYLAIQVSPVTKWVVSYYPGIAGYARLHIGAAASTAYPLVAYSEQTLYLLDSAAGDQYQGLAILNPSNSAATVTVQAIDPTGLVLATTTVSMKAGEFSAKLLTERFGTSIPERSVIRVSSSTPVFALSVTGTGLTSLRAIPALF